MKKISKREIISKLFILIAICLLCYPTIAEIYNAYHSSYIINEYMKNVNEMKKEVYAEMLEKAKSYNEQLASKPPDYILSKEEMEEYMSILNVSGNGVMGSISIPKINVNLPIYHTTEDEFLQIAVGHIPGTSFPIGGPSTNSVISGHRGMSSYKLFTDLPKLVEGDTFKIFVLNEVFTYQIDKIETVYPDQIDGLKIEEGKEYCTLITCTPIGINNQRTIVRGHRVETKEEKAELKDINVAKQLFTGNVLSTYELIMLSIALALFIIMFIYPFIKNKINKKQKGDKKE